MLSSSQGMDFDVLSDITGISMDKEDNDDKLSQRSGSIGSDNTDILLNQNISLNEFDGSDSYLESISQVASAEHSPFSIKQNSSMANYYHVSNSSLHDTISNDFLSKPTNTEFSSLQLGVDSLKSSNGPDVVNKGLHFTETKNVSNFGASAQQDGVQNSATSYSIKKFPSDTNITGRRSVIRHHASMPVINTETSLSKFSNESQWMSLDGQERKHKKSQQVRFHPMTFANDSEDDLKDDPTGYENTKALSGNKIQNQQTGTYNTFEGHGSGRIAVNNEHLFGSSNGQQGLDLHNNLFVATKSNERDLSLNDFHESQTGKKLQGGQKKGSDDMLLGVRHDPSTNELYDDKVREGADLLLRVLRDPNGSFTSISSLSRESDKIEQTRLNLSQENKPPNPNSSASSSETIKVKSSFISPERFSDPGSSTSNVNPNTRKSNSEATKIFDGPAFKESLTWKRDQQIQEQSGTGMQDGHGRTAIQDPRFDDVRNGYSTTQGHVTRQTLEAAPGSENLDSNENEVSDVDELIQKRADEVQRLEQDIDEILSRKKTAAHELKVFEQSLERNKAEMMSSENLVEQYRWQATQARSELLELEKARNELRENYNSLQETLKKSKGHESFNSDEMRRSKEEIFVCFQERDKFEKELREIQETLKRERERGKRSQDDLSKKMCALEEQLKKQHKGSVEDLQKVKEEHNSNAELLEEKYKRETNFLRKTVETAESRVQQLEKSLVEKGDEFSKLRIQLREEKQRNLEMEKKWRSQLESERHEIEIRGDEQERSFKDRDEKHIRRETELENLLEERTADLRRSEERRKAQAEELQKIIENKNEEVKLIRGLVRQQEDATRVLGERLRTEAREHVRNAVEKERESLSKEKERVNKTVDEGKEKNTRIIKQLGEQLDMEKESHLQTKQALNKLKHEAEELRKQVVEVHGERITSVQRARQQGSDELGKIREELREFTIHAEKLEKVDRESARAIYEECRKVAELVEMPVPFVTPTRFPDEKQGEKAFDPHQSPTKEALASLKRYNEELRQKLVAMKQEMDKQRPESGQIKKSHSKEHDDEVPRLEKLLQEKNEEIQQLNKKYSEEIKQLQTERKRDQLTYKKTVAKLEQEFHKLHPTNVLTGVTSTTKRDLLTTRNMVSLASHETNSSLGYNSPNISLRAPEASPHSTSTDLLKHLQERVKKLRAENENLKKSSDDTSSNLPRQREKLKGFNNATRLQRLLDTKEDSKSLQTNTR